MITSADIDLILTNAIAAHQAGRMNEAETGYRTVLSRDADNAVALCQLGTLAAQLGHADAARQLIERAIAVAPTYPSALNALGVLHASHGREPAAEECFRKALGLDGQAVETMRNLGTLLVATGRAAEALSYLERADAIAPGSPEITINYAAALAAHDRLEESERLLRRVLAATPRNPTAMNNLAIVLQAQGRIGDAIDSFKQAIVLSPEYANAHYNLAIALLLAGRYADGWREHEWRRRKTRTELSARRYDAPLWDGRERVKTLFVYAEQGFGDMIQFARFLPALRGRTDRIVFECTARLQRLLRDSSLTEAIELCASAPASFDAHCGLMSLPHFFGIGVDEIAANARPYLVPEAALIARWRAHLGPKTHHLRVGICWQGTPTFAADAQRSIPLRYFARLAALPGVQLISLQKGTGSEQIAGFGAPLVDLGAKLDLDHAFVDTAAVIASLDLVITSDTSIAHLAGALGAPVWTLLAFAPDWRWMTGRDDTPWYSSMTLFRQSKRGNWNEVFERVALALQSM